MSITVRRGKLGVGAAPIGGTSFPLTIPFTPLSKKVAISYPRPAHYLDVVYDFSMGYSTNGIAWPMKITRISEIGASPRWTGNYVQYGYPNRQPWNLDGTILKAGRSDFYDGNTYQFIRTHSGLSYYSLWSNQDANKLWQFAAAGEVRYLDVAANVSKPWFTLASKGYGTVTAMGVGNNEGAIDNNDKYTVLNFMEGGYQHFALIDLQTKSVIWDHNAAFFGIAENNVDLIRVSADGETMLVTQKDNVAHLWNTVACTRIVGTGDWGSGSHYDIVKSLDGTKQYATRLGPTPKLYEIPSGVVTNMFTPSVFNATFGSISKGGHMARLPAVEGVLHCSFLDDTVDEYILNARMDYSNMVQKFCHSRCDRIPNRGAHSSPNRDGTKSMFESNWNSGSNYEMYICEVPSQEDLESIGIFL